jgi:hypothetical protein
MRHRCTLATESTLFNALLKPASRLKTTFTMNPTRAWWRCLTRAAQLSMEPERIVPAIVSCRHRRSGGRGDTSET